MDTINLRNILNYDLMCRRANIPAVLSLDERILIHKRIANPEKTPFTKRFVNKLQKLTQKLKNVNYQPVTLQISVNHEEYAVAGNEKMFINPETALKLLHNGRAN